MLLSSLTAIGLAAVPGRLTAQTINSTVVTELRFDAGRPRWARFSPANPNSILLEVDGRGYLATLPQGTIRRIADGNLPVGWLGGTLVVDQSGTFKLLDPDNLTPATDVIVGSVPLPRTYGPGRRMRFVSALSGDAASTIPSVIPDADTTGFAMFAREEAGFSVVNETQVIGVGGRVVFTAEKKIYGIAVSPDDYKLVLYFGNRDYVLFNRLSQRTSVLPTEIETWTWLPDGTTLLGEVTEPASLRYEAVGRTQLYLYEAGGGLVGIELPAPLDNAALRILDVSTEGHVLFEAEQVVPESVYYGVRGTKIEWR